MLREAKLRGLSPIHVVFDSWYSGLENLKAIRELGWEWLTRFKSNRQVNPDPKGNRAISDREIGPQGRVVHLKGYGLVKVFKRVAQNGDMAYWASSHLEMKPLERLKWAELSWTIENDHRGIKPSCGVERAQVRAARAQRNHLGLALRAFLRQERYSFRTG